MALEEATARNVRRRLNARSSGPRHPQQRDDADEEDNDLDLDDIDDAGADPETRADRIRRFDRDTREYYEDKFGDARPELIK